MQAILTKLEIQEPESWHQIPGFASYQISTYGRIRTKKIWFRVKNDLAEWRIFNPATGNHGYLVTIIKNDKEEKCQVRIHQLVAITFIGPCPSGHEVHHKDRDKLNNFYKNIEYKLKSDHSALHNNTLSKSEVQEIRNLYLNHEDNISKLSIICERSEPTIREVLRDLIDKYESPSHF